MSRRRNIYPFDASDPKLKWCKNCDYPYMPAGACKVHEGRCLTCCTQEGADCIRRMSTGDLLAAKEVLTKEAKWLEDERARRVQADIDALYGPPGGQP